MDSKKRTASEADIASVPAPKRQAVTIREPSIFGIKPVDDITKYIADFIAEHVHLEDVEVILNKCHSFASLYSPLFFFFFSW